MSRVILAALFAAALAAAGPAEWVPLRWEGGPLEVRRRAQPDFEAASPIASELLLQAYQPDSLDLFNDTPFNCLLLTWSLGEPTDDDAEQRSLAAALARRAQQRGVAAMAVIEPGSAWIEALEAAAEASFDGVVLDGDFSAEQVQQAADVLAGRGALVALGDWRRTLALREPAVIGPRDGIWPMLFTAEDESDTFQSGPTTNPWVLSNGWRVAAVRAGAAGRPVWAGHRPKRYRDQPFSATDYVRAVADTAMAGGRWAVALDGEWQAGLLNGDEEKLEGWRRIAAAAAFFEQHAAWREIPPQPAVVVALDPDQPDVFSHADTLNLLAVRHVPHRVVLRPELSRQGLPKGLHGLTFDHEPSDDEATAIDTLIQSGGTLFTGPRWGRAGVSLGIPKAALGAGGLMAYPSEKFEEDQFATDLRKRLDESGSTIRIFNTGTLMSFYTEQGDRGVLHITEYSDYPTDNVTVRFPRKIAKAVWTTLEGDEEELEVYDTDGGGEIVIPETSWYCAVTIDFLQP